MEPFAPTLNRIDEMQRHKYKCTEHAHRNYVMAMDIFMYLFVHMSVYEGLPVWKVVGDWELEILKPRVVRV